MKQKVKGRNVGAYETLNEVLVSLFRDVNDIEQKAIIISEFSDITNNDMHVIDAIGIDRPKNMSSIARELSVTVGTLTISVNSLVKKGYVVRNRSSEDRRVVFISLSEKGVKAYYHHKKFHEQMIDSVVKELTEEELEALVKALTKLNTWFRSF
nr:MarR family transcriptional regulator [Enterocloster clostridioformis]